jgi:hypothetical protein
LPVHIIDEDESNGQQPYTGYVPDDDTDTDWSAIFNAPDYSQLIRRTKTQRARAYEKKMNSLLKAGLVTSLNTRNFPDAAAILKLGPAFSTATGELADTNVHARKVLDIITEPGNPVALFALTAIPLIAQLFRNHEPAIKAMPSTFKNRKERRAARAAAEETSPPRFTVKLPFVKKQIKLRFGVHLRLSKVLAGFRSQTVEPEFLASQVFTDPDVLDALKKMGVFNHAGE